MIVQIAHNAVTAKLVGASREVKLQVQQALTYTVDGAEFSDAFKMGSWDGKSSFLNFTEGTFPRGFVPLVQKHLITLGHTVHVVKKPYPAPLGLDRPKVDSFAPDPRYDYQDLVTDRLVKHGQIIARVATGGGKSRIAKLCTARIGRKTLFITTRGVLMYQMAGNFESISPVTIIGDGNMSLKTEPVTCAMVQTLAAWLKENKEDERQMARRREMIKLLESFEFVILEEAHEVSGNLFFEILRHCKNAHYRLALTATPFMKDSEESNMRLMASSGGVAIEVSEKMLIDRGILAKPYFKFIELKECPPKLYKSTPWQRAYELGITENELRNKHVVAEAMRAVRYGLPVMVLVQHKKHGKLLKEVMARNGLRCTYIFGEDNQSARKTALNDLKNGNIDVLIGSTILDVGVDVPAVGMVILAGGGKAEVANRQRIGRGLREKKDMPNVAFIVDFADGHNNHLKAHYKQRRAIIESTPGFAENIVTDFDYTGLGFVRKAA